MKDKVWEDERPCLHETNLKIIAQSFHFVHTNSPFRRF